MTGELTLIPIGRVEGGRTQPVDDDWDAVRATIVLDPDRFGPEALAGLGDFSHLEVVYSFHAAAADKIVLGARHPRGRADWPLVAILAQRGTAPTTWASASAA